MSAMGAIMRNFAAFLSVALMLLGLGWPSHGLAQEAKNDILELSLQLKSLNDQTDPLGTKRADAAYKIAYMTIGQKKSDGLQAAFDTLEIGLQALQGKPEVPDVLEAKNLLLQWLLKTGSLISQFEPTERYAQMMLDLIPRVMTGQEAVVTRTNVQLILAQTLSGRGAFVQSDAILRTLLQSEASLSPNQRDDAEYLLVNNLTTQFRVNEARQYIENGLARSRAGLPSTQRRYDRWVGFAIIVRERNGQYQEALTLIKETLGFELIPPVRLGTLIDAAGLARKAKSPNEAKSFLDAAVALESELRATNQLNISADQLQLRVIEELAAASRQDDAKALIASLNLERVFAQPSSSLYALTNMHRLTVINRILGDSELTYRQAKQTGHALIAGPGSTYGIDPDAQRTFRVLRNIFLVQMQMGWQSAHKAKG